MPWPLNRSEAGGDVVSLQTFVGFSYVNDHVHGLVRARRFATLSASLIFKSQGTEHTTVKWRIYQQIFKLCCSVLFNKSESQGCAKVDV